MLKLHLTKFRSWGLGDTVGEKEIHHNNRFHISWYRCISQYKPIIFLSIFNINWYYLNMSDGYFLCKDLLSKVEHVIGDYTAVLEKLKAG